MFQSRLRPYAYTLNHVSEQPAPIHLRLYAEMSSRGSVLSDICSSEGRVVSHHITFLTGTFLEPKCGDQSIPSANSLITKRLVLYEAQIVKSHQDLKFVVCCVASSIPDQKH